MHVDFSHKRLTELRDAIEDTEDLAEINLDSQRNQLIKIDLVLSNGMLSVGIFSMVAGTFGMNLEPDGSRSRGVPRGVYRLRCLLFRRLRLRRRLPSTAKVTVDATASRFGSIRS